MSGHCDHHTERDGSKNGGKLPFLRPVADRYARFRCAMRDLWAFLNGFRPPVAPPLDLTLVAARLALRDMETRFATMEDDAGLFLATKPVLRLTRVGWFRVPHPARSSSILVGPYGTAGEALSLPESRYLTCSGRPQ